jgi:hypothetical protein
MKRTLIIGLFSLIVTTAASAQISSGTHQVTVAVNQINAMQVSGGGVAFSIGEAQAVAGQDQILMTNTSTQLLWGTNVSARKITVQSSLGTPRFTLRIFASGPTVGTASPEVTLGTLAADFLRNIGRSSGTCTLRYTAVVLASLGTGTDNHTITFTMVAQ